MRIDGAKAIEGGRLAPLKRELITELRRRAVEIIAIPRK